MSNNACRDTCQVCCDTCQVALVVYIKKGDMPFFGGASLKRGKKRWEKVACGVMGWDGGPIENLVQRIIRSMQEPSADYGGPQLSQQKQITHTKSKSEICGEICGDI